MPFNKDAVFKTDDTYKKELKKELNSLDATLGEFYFFDDAPVNGSTQSILLVGTVTQPIVKKLKASAKASAKGQCFLEGSTLKLSLTKGKMPETKLKPVFKGIPFDFKLISGDLDAGTAEKSDDRFENRLQSVVSRFDKIKGKITDDERKELRILFGKIADVKDSDTTKAAKLIEATDKRMAEIVKVAGLGGEASADETNAKTRLKATTARFDKVKGHLMDDERKSLRILFGDAVDAIKKSDWKAAYKTLETLDVQMVAMVRAALKGSEDDAEKREKDFDGSDAGAAVRQIASTIKSELTKLGKLESVVTREADTLKELQETLGSLTKPKDIEKKRKQVDASEDRLEMAKQVLDTSREELTSNVKRLKAEKLEKEKGIVAALGNLQNRIKALDGMLDSVPVDQARSALEGTIRKMAEATEWREKQFEKEASGGEGHGTGRHGAQTGMDRQARRAATKKGITPEQGDNPTGVSQSVSWNKVKIIYTEENGKRVVQDREKTAQTLASQISGKQYSGGNASMWATPVLEKEAVDRAMVVGNKLKDFTHYFTGKTDNAGNVTTNFDSLTVVLDAPSKGPGWGYAMKRTGAEVDPVVATNVLKDFEKGTITQDQLFKNLNVELVEKPNGDGVKMIKRCKVILMRANGGDAWKIRTHFPDDQLKKKDQGWECERNQTKGDVTFKKGGTLSVLKNNETV